MKNRKEWEYKMKKDHIVEVALDLFLEKGFPNVTLSDVAKKAGYSKSSLYTYFDSKEDFLNYFFCYAEAELLNYFDELSKRIDSGVDIFVEIVERMYKKNTTVKKIHDFFLHNVRDILIMKVDFVEKIENLQKKRLEVAHKLLSNYFDDPEKLNFYSYLFTGFIESIAHYLYWEKEPVSKEKLIQYAKGFVSF